MNLNEFYCVKCRMKVKILDKNICMTYINNKKIGKMPALKAYCKKCDTNLTKFVKRDEGKKLDKKFNK